jgi:hypothetical protein
VPAANVVLVNSAMARALDFAMGWSRDASVPPLFNRSSRRTGRAHGTRVSHGSVLGTEIASRLNSFRLRWFDPTGSALSWGHRYCGQDTPSRLKANGR